MKRYLARVCQITCLMILGCTGNVANSAVNNNFPFGVFDKSDPYEKFDKKDFQLGSKEWEAYRKKFTRMLEEYNINTVINAPYKDDRLSRFVLDQFYENNIKVIFQPGNSFNNKSSISAAGSAINSIYRHPAIIAYKLGNEPKTQEKLDKLSMKYALIEKHYQKPIITAMIGEVMGAPDRNNKLKLKGNTDDMAVKAWEQLDSKVLFARHYPYRRQYDLVDWYQEKMKMPFHDWCAYMETAYKDRPWWYIPQLFGKGKEKERKSYWRLPTSNEINALVHTALAHGARGIIGWGIPTYDYTRKPTRKMFIDEKLTPETARDGSIPMEQYAEIGKLVNIHGDLLLRHKRADFKLNDTNPQVLKVPRYDPLTEKSYIYVVNLNTETDQSASFIIASSLDISKAKDIYSNRKLSTNQVDEGTLISYRLAPGEALFIELN